MPPEWAPHERCVVAWPCRADMWGGQLDAAKAAHAAVVNAIVAFEPVLLVSIPGAGAEEWAACPGASSVRRTGAPACASAPERSVLRASAWLSATAHAVPAILATSGAMSSASFNPAA